MPTTKYPFVHVRLVDGSAFAIVGAAPRGQREADVPRREIDPFATEALAGDYATVLRLAASWGTST